VADTRGRAQGKPSSSGDPVSALLPGQRRGHGTVALPSPARATAPALPPGAASFARQESVLVGSKAVPQPWAPGTQRTRTLGLFKQPQSSPCSQGSVSKRLKHLHRIRGKSGTFWSLNQTLSSPHFAGEVVGNTIAPLKNGISLLKALCPMTAGSETLEGTRISRRRCARLAHPTQPGAEPHCREMPGKLIST